MDDDDETWLTPGLSSKTTPSSTTSSSSKGTQSDADSWLKSGFSSGVDYSTRADLSMKLRKLQEKKARRKLRSASIVSLESVSEEVPSPPPPTSSTTLRADDDRLDTVSDLLDTTIFVPSGDRSIDEGRGKSIDYSPSIDSPFGVDEIDSPFGADEDEEYKKLEEEALNLSLEEDRVEDELETTQDDDEFLSAASEFEDEELEAAHHIGRSRELESLVEEPARTARQQVLGGARLGVSARSSSVSPRLAATVQPATVTPKPAVTRVVSSEITSTPVGAMHTLPRRPQVDAVKGGGMSVSLHMPSGHLPPRRVPPGKTSENGRSTVGGGGPKEEKKKVNLHEDLAKIQDVAREQEEALRREVMGCLSANDVSNGENDARLITNSKSVDFVGGKKEFHSRLPTPSRRVIPVRAPSRGPMGGGGGVPLRAAPNSVMPGCPIGGGVSSFAQSGPTTGQNEDQDGCF